MFTNVAEEEGETLKSSAVSEITGWLWDIKRTFTRLVTADIMAVWLFEDMNYLTTDVMHQHFLRA